MKADSLVKFGFCKSINLGSTPKKCLAKFEFLSVSILKTTLKGGKWFALPKLFDGSFPVAE